jgi:BlaI family penicillinase repressor
MTNLRFGQVQYKIMQVIWDHGRVNARDITDTMNKTKPIAHSTVQTLLRKLEQKGAVAHDVEDRTFIFYPLVKREKVTQFGVRDIIDRMFAGSPGALVSNLIKNEKFTKQELSEIKRLISEKEK